MEKKLLTRHYAYIFPDYGRLSYLDYVREWDEAVELFADQDGMDVLESTTREACYDVINVFKMGLHKLYSHEKLTSIAKNAEFSIDIYVTEENECVCEVGKNMRNYLKKISTEDEMEKIDFLIEVCADLMDYNCWLIGRLLRGICRENVA